MNSQKNFQINYIWWALRLAIFAGFALGAHTISIIGFDFPLGKGFYGYIQTHGHIQLVGWAGLFIMGVSLHFIPRLAGVPIEPAGRMRFILWAIVSGLIIRYLSHSMLAYITTTAMFFPVSVMACISGVLVWIGAVTYVVTIIQTMTRLPISEQRPALKAIKPFFLMMMAGWLIYPAMNMVLLVEMTYSGVAAVHQGWNEIAVQIFINLVALPVAFAFSVRLFPLFLRLPVIDWAVSRIALFFFLAVCLQLMPLLPPVLVMESELPLKLASVGMVLKFIVILTFIWKLDVLTRRRAPWTVLQELHPGPGRPPTRPGLPDYGEFGAFEKLVYSSYSWLILGALMEATIGFSVLFNFTIPISSDVIRHVYLLGFITQLILGMAVRMIPGFLGKRQVAKPKYVLLTFWLINIAVIGRIFPLVIPGAWIEAVPGAVFFARAALGLSGFFGMAAVVVLALNLRATAKGIKSNSINEFILER